LTQPKYPDNFNIKPPNPYITPQPNETLDKHISNSHYDRAVNRVPPGKAPKPDAITIELITHLPDDVHTLVYTLFKTTAKHIYTQKNCVEAQPAYFTNRARRTYIALPTIGR